MAYLDNVTNILQIQPDGLPTVVRLSQNENGRRLYFRLVGNEDPIPSGVTVTISGTKPDGVVYSASGSITNDVVLINENTQMTAVAGTWDAKIKIVSSGQTIATGRVRFEIDADTVAPGSVPSDSELEGLVAEAQAYAENARSAAYGSPLTASTVAGMTDQTRVYVYTGSESGYTSGHWYYWSGSAWTDGGVYNSAAVQTDTTLELPGMAADAKATGDAVRGLGTRMDTAEDDITDLKSGLENLEPITEDVKVALLDCFEHVAWIDEHGQDYYDALEAALYPDTGLVSISAVFTQGSAVIYPSTPLNDLKAYLVVTGYYNDGTSKTITDYSLSGILEVGTSTITVTKEGKTDTFDVVVSSSYWDYEWYASSRTLPEGMTSDGYDFTTESGAMLAETPNLDFDFIGNCELEVEMKAHVESSSGTIEYGGSNPQIVIKNAVVSSNQFRGAKIILNFSSSGVANLVGIGINGINSNIQGIKANDYHVYNVRAENNVYSLSVDGETKQVTQNNNTSQYFSFTGLASSLKPDGGFYGALIKSIKFKRL